VVGALQLIERSGRRGPVADAVVWIPGLPGAQQRAARLAQRNKQFEPRVVVVGRGGKVSFPNTDSIFHNVFSTTRGSEFDLGLYRGGTSREWTFTKPGVVRVFCNIHPVMAGWVLVLDQPDPVFAVTDSFGRARLTGIPAGQERIRIWHEKGGEREVTVDVAAGRETSFAAVLDASAWKKDSHEDKWGNVWVCGADGKCSAR
jgi:plastocyanin